MALDLSKYGITKTEPNIGNKPQEKPGGIDFGKYGTVSANVDGKYDLTSVKKEQTLGEKIAQPFKELPAKLGEDISAGAKDIQSGMATGGLRGVPETLKGMVKSGLRTVGDIAITALSPIGTAINELTGGTLDKMSEDVVKGIEQRTSPVGQFIGKITDSPEVQKFATEHPNLGEDLQRVLTLLFLKNVKGDIKNIPSTLKTEGSKLLEKGERTLETIQSKTGEIFKGKTKENVLSTPKEQVYKLKPEERKVWFENEAEKIKSRTAEETQTIKNELKQQTETSKQVLNDLQKELSTASRDKVIELRPKIRQAMSEQSKTYRKLVDEAIGEKGNVEVDVNELKSFVDSTFSDNPVVADAIKGKLGLQETPTALKKGELPTIETQGNIRTIGDIYSQLKSLKQEISSGANKGTKTFTADDIMVDKAINTLSSFLKDKGIDFSEANSFWSKYAPIRDQIVRESKPFLQTATQTKTFAGTLERVVKGKDINNENFISEVENLLGEKILNKEVASKITQAEKEAIANKIASEEKLLDAKMAQEKALKKLSDEEFAIERNSRLRKATINAIKVVVGFKIAQKLGITQMIGI